MGTETMDELVKQFEERRKNVITKINKRDFINLCKFVKKELEKKNIDFKQFDILNEIDFSLSYYENLEILKKKLAERYGISFTEDIKSNIEKWEREQLDFWEREHKREFEEIKKRILESSDVDINKYFEDYENVIKLFLSSEKKGLLVFGDKGKGKTFNTIRILQKLKKQFELVKGHITPLQLFRKLYECNNSIIIFDDVADMLKDKKKMALLLGALDKLGEVCWLSSMTDLPSRFCFNGKIIIILNKVDINNEIQEALYDRCIPYQFDKLINRNKMLEMITILAKKENVSLDVVSWLNQNKIDISFRDYEMIRDIYKNNKDNWKEVAEYILLNEVEEELNDTDKKVLEIIIKHSDKSNNQKAKIFTEETGKGRMTFYRHLKKLRKLGLVSF